MTYTGASDTVTFSGVQPVATHSQRWLRVTLHAAAGRYPFEIATCGGVRIWCNGLQVACFTPFTRNTLQTSPVEITLQSGGNTLLVHLDELFERDTIFAFRMTYLAGEPLEAELPEVNNADANTLRAFMDSLPSATVTRHSTLQLSCLADISLGLGGAVYGQRDCIATCPLDFGSLKTGHNGLILPLPETLGIGHYRLELTASLGDVVMSRSLSATVLSDAPLPGGEGVLETRKREALSYIARHGVPRMTPAGDAARW